MQLIWVIIKKTMKFSLQEAMTAYIPWNSRGRFFILVLKITRRAEFVFKFFFHVIFKSLLFLTQKYITTRITFY